ncbi:condensation domain-containing protein [Saccharothrix longispora]|uniref:condensation domain-containing protein n=1 Tax=Saccharothrix longispora TaxID=33920 RepID=UPI0028FDBAE0|nr:condensation domain-containing protein [Saccharothrix longispora]MDU0294179.1 condensation domain-containing protein [Saccharothrix longispora]
MKTTELSDYPIPAGRLREWRPHVPDLPTASALAHDPTPPSYNQERHLRVVTALRRGDTGFPTWIGIAFDLAGALDVEAFRRALRTWIGRHETLRSGFHAAGGDFHRFTLDRDTVSVVDTVLGDFTPADDVAAYLVDRLTHATDATRWPSYVVETVERAASTTVIAALDHSNADGYSIFAVIRELHDLYDAAVHGRADVPAGTGSYVDFSRAERIAAHRVDRHHPAAVRWAAFLDACGGGLPTFPLDLGVEDGVCVPQGLTTEHLLDAPESAAFEAACRAGRSSVLAGVLTATAISCHALRRQPVHRFITPLHTRVAPEWSRSMGWYVGAGPVEIALDGATDFRDLLPRAQKAARTANRVAQTPLVKVLEVLDVRLRHSHDMFSFVSFLDLRDVPGSERWAEWNARTLVGKSHNSKASFWVNRTREDLHVTARYPDTATARENVGHFLGRLKAVVRSVAETGNHSLP